MLTAPCAATGLTGRIHRKVVACSATKSARDVTRIFRDGFSGFYGYCPGFLACASRQCHSRTCAPQRRELNAADHDGFRPPFFANWISARTVGTVWTRTTTGQKRGQKTQENPKDLL